jgi:hypothetical protein
MDLGSDGKERIWLSAMAKIQKLFLFRSPKNPCIVMIP